MRIRTDGENSWRADVIEEAADVLDRNKTAAITTACEHLVADREAKRELAKYLADEQAAGRLSDDQIHDIIAIFNSPRVHVAPSYLARRQAGTDVDVSKKE